MNKKGFTLIELLAVIIILGVIATITMIASGKILSGAKENLNDSQISIILRGAEAYNIKEGMNANATCVNISTLNSKGYFNRTEIKNLKTGEDLGGSVKITYESNNYKYEYQEIECSE